MPSRPTTIPSPVPPPPTSNRIATGNQSAPALPVPSPPAPAAAAGPSSSRSATPAVGARPAPQVVAMGARAEAEAAAAAREGRGGGKNAIVVNARQRGNPILAHIRNVPWEYGDIVPDYVVGQHTCVLFLSLRYARLHPEYLHQRIEKLQGMYQLRILLLMCDVNDHQEAIREISKICLINNLTIIVAWTPEEAGLYLATYKIYEHKPPDSLKGRVDNDYRSVLNRALTGIKGVNRTDCLTLSTNFGSFDRITHASPEELSLCPGLGDVKVRRLFEAFTAPFVNSAGRGGGGGQLASMDRAPKEAQAAAKKREKAGKDKGKGKERAMSFVDVGDDDNDAEEEAEKGEAAERQYSPDWSSSGDEGEEKKKDAEEPALVVVEEEEVMVAPVLKKRKPNPFVTMPT